MTEDTQQFIKIPGTGHGGESSFLKISIRAWLALLLIGSVCSHSIALIALSIIQKDAALLKVTEPLYTMSGMALAYYFGQQKDGKQLTK